MMSEPRSGRNRTPAQETTLRELLPAISPATVVGDPAVQVRGIAFDSRKVVPGDLFVALPGRRFDGARYISQAAARGAVAAVTQRYIPEARFPQVIVPDARRSMALLAAAYWGQPSRLVRLIGVTGTDGKTTTSNLIAELFDAAGIASGLVSTTQIRIDGQPQPSPFVQTTPESPDIQRVLASIVASGARHAVLEVSSHALALDRVLSCEFDVAVFTNLSPEHLDFHQTMAEYCASKARLFESLGAPTAKTGRRFGVVNIDDPYAAAFQRACRADLLTYGIESPAEIRARDLWLGQHGSSFIVDTPIGSRRLFTRFVGRFNVYNWLAAIAVAVGSGISLDAIERAALTARPVSGRMQRIDAGQPFTVIVDFAHTPQALAAVLETSRGLCRRRVILVVGHPGERYAPHRPAIGTLAVRHADLAILTADDPYGEDKDQIIDQIVSGAVAAGGVESRDFLVIRERRDAIKAAIDLARPGDLVLIAGRGHLREMVIGDRRIPFNDAEVATAALRRAITAAA